jgi:hypothetical protein
MFKEKEIETRICKWCLELFTPPKPWSKFCCDKCRNAWHTKERRIAVLALRAQQKQHG